MTISFSHVEKQRARRRGGRLASPAEVSPEQGAAAETFWPWTGWRRSRSFSLALSSVGRRRGTAGGVGVRQLCPGLKPGFCFRWGHLCLIECLWIAGLRFCCVAQTNRCVVRDGAGGWGALGATASPPRGRPRRVLFTCLGARRALGAQRGWRQCRRRAFPRLHPAGFCPSLRPRLGNPTPASRHPARPALVSPCPAGPASKPALQG